MDKNHVVLEWDIAAKTVNFLRTFLQDKRDMDRFDAHEDAGQVVLRGLGVCEGDVQIAKLRVWYVYCAAALSLFLFSQTIGFSVPSSSWQYYAQFCEGAKTKEDCARALSLPLTFENNFANLRHDNNTLRSLWAPSRWGVQRFLGRLQFVYVLRLKIFARCVEDMRKAEESSII